MVAKSFQSFEMLGEPYEKNKKMYVKVKNPKTSTVREVRWYDEKEYAKLYPEEEVEIHSYGPQKHALGFDNGYITIFKGAVEENEEFFKFSNARYATFWGWYIVSTEDVPSDLPAGVEPVCIEWAEVGNSDGYLKSDKEVKAAVESKLFAASNSKWVGNIGDRLDITVEVIDKIKKDTQYGTSNTHIMCDTEGNTLIWITCAKDWDIGATKHIRGTVKDHSTFKNVKTTYLTRCMEVK